MSRRLPFRHVNTSNSRHICHHFLVSLLLVASTFALTDLSHLHVMSLVSIVTMSLLLLSQVNSIKISEDSFPLDLVRRILDSASEVHLALLRSGEWSDVPTSRQLQPTIYTYDTSDDEFCLAQRPSQLRLSPTPKRQRSPSGCGTGNVCAIQGVDARRHGHHLSPCPSHIPQRSISAPSSPMNKTAAVHLSPHLNHMHCFHSDHSDDDSSDSCPMGSPIRHVFASGPRLQSHSYVNCNFPIRSQNGNAKQLGTLEQGTYIHTHTHTCVRVHCIDWLLGSSMLQCCLPSVCMLVPRGGQYCTYISIHTVHTHLGEWVIRTYYIITVYSELCAVQV